jgi:hypothetical protein
MSQDIWFRRGWTLTELLAPRRMKFYGAGWKALNNDYVENDKADRSFLALLSKATGIPVDDLRSYWPGPDRVREKLRWASGRNTYRMEDRAYSLMALFDVRISLAYGEREGAFTRLMLAIIPRCGECDVFAWAGPPSFTNPAIPLSPESYGEERLVRNLSPDAHYYRLCGDRTLTSDADCLRLSVVTVEVALPARVARYTPKALSHHASISEVTLLQPQDLSTDRDPDVQMAIGVIDYGWTNRPDEGVLLRGVEYFGFLLQKSSRLAGWYKVPTEKVVFLVNEEELQQGLEILHLSLGTN